MYKQFKFIRNGTLLLVFTLSANFIYGQEEIPALITDRPDATEAPQTVPRGALQIETGAFYTSFEENNFKEESFTYNTTLLRYGILDNLELRLGWNFEEGRTSTNNLNGTDVISGLSPLLAGVKVNIIEEEGLMPTIGLIGHLFLPFSAGTDYKPETTAIDFKFSFAHTLTESSSLSYNLGAQWDGDQLGASYIYTLAYGYSFTEKFGGYVEVYGDFPEKNKANHFWDAGVTYLLFPNLQLDATVGTGITKGQDLLLSAGLSYRILK